MVANISPASANLAETISTLRFAQRAKNIRNKVCLRSEHLHVIISAHHAEEHLAYQAEAVFRSMVQLEQVGFPTQGHNHSEQERGPVAVHV
jgi:hypothetical protein